MKKKRKKLVIYLVLLVLAVFGLCYFIAPGNRAKALVKSYYRWSDLTLRLKSGGPLIRDFFRLTANRLEMLFSKDCKIIINGRIETERTGLGLNVAMLMPGDSVCGDDAREAVLKKLSVEKRGNFFLATKASIFLSNKHRPLPHDPYKSSAEYRGRLVQVIESEFVIKKQGRKLLITEIRETRRGPNAEEKYLLNPQVEDVKRWLREKHRRPL